MPRVRPYALTRGRTRFGHPLAVETLVAAVAPGPPPPEPDVDVPPEPGVPPSARPARLEPAPDTRRSGRSQASRTETRGGHGYGHRHGRDEDRREPEKRAIVEICRRARPVAEIAALLKMPLGVVRVLLSDLADQGWVRVHGTGPGTEHDAGRLDRALLERVLSGLRTL